MDSFQNLIPEFTPSYMKNNRNFIFPASFDQSGCNFIWLIIHLFCNLPDSLSNLWIDSVTIF